DKLVTGVQTCALPICPGRVQDAGRPRDIPKRAIAVVLEEDVLAAAQSWGTAGHLEALVEAGSSFRDGGGLYIEVDIVGDKQIERSEERRVGKEGRCRE